MEELILDGSKVLEHNEWKPPGLNCLFILTNTMFSSNPDVILDMSIIEQIDCEGHGQGEISHTGTKQIFMVKLHRGCALPFRKLNTYKITHELYMYAKHFVCPSHKVNIFSSFICI